MMVALSIIIGIFILGIMVIIHELGHFTAAKLLRFRVLAFSVGFGKVLLKKTIGETEYRISAIPFGGDLPKIPRAMTATDIARVQNDFVATAKRALMAGFEWLELHAAHGYLFNEFLSPLANHRTDQYGGSFENRTRFLLDTTRAVRQVWPDKLPLAVRISAIDWKEGGWDIEQSIELAKLLKAVGVDLMDCSSGGVVPDAKITVVPGYQVPFA